MVLMIALGVVGWGRGVFCFEKVPVCRPSLYHIYWNNISFVLCFFLLATFILLEFGNKSALS